MTTGDRLSSDSATTLRYGYAVHMPCLYSIFLLSNSHHTKHIGPVIYVASIRLAANMIVPCNVYTGLERISSDESSLLLCKYSASQCHPLEFHFDYQTICGAEYVGETLVSWESLCNNAQSLLFMLLYWATGKFSVCTSSCGFY